jgi:hypothetical protein
MAPIQNVDEETIPLVAVASGSATEGGIATTTIAVDGMTCGACTSAIEGAFYYSVPAEFHKRCRLPEDFA